MTRDEFTPAVARIFDRVGSIETPMMGGDNISIVLCGYFENPDQEEDGETGWTPDAVSGCDEVLAAIREHFAPLRDRIAQLEAENARLREVLTHIRNEGGQAESRVARAALQPEDRT